MKKGLLIIELTNLHKHTATLELVLAFIGAFGMILMVLNPLSGQLLMGGALAMLFVMYLIISILPPDPEADSRFHVILQRINFIVASIAGIVLLTLLAFLPHNLALSFPVLILLLICMVLNLAHRYLYGIYDKAYMTNQVRLVMLAAILILIVRYGP